MSALDSLIEMGFPKNRAEKALAITGNQGVPPAMEWLFAHMEDPDIDEPYTAPQGHRLTDAPASSTGASSSGNGTSTAGNGDSSATADAETLPEGVAASLKCDECGKQLRDTVAAQAHAERTGHSQFSESVEAIKPLTEEEKAAQKERLLKVMSEKRQMREEQEKKEAVEREKMRRKSGKEVVDAKEKYAQQMRMREAEVRRREQAEAKKAKDEILAKVAADKAARAAAKAKAAAPPATAAQPAAASSAVSAPPVKKQYTECRIRFRLPDGSAVIQTFAASDTFSTVFKFVQGKYDGQFQLKTAQPPKTFGSYDVSESLQSLGLVPSATLMVMKL